LHVEESLSAHQIGALRQEIEDMYNMNLLRPSRTLDSNWSLHSSGDVMTARSLAKLEALSEFVRTAGNSPSSLIHAASSMGKEYACRRTRALLRDEARNAGIESLTQMSDLISFKNILTIVEEFAYDIGQYAVTIAADGIDYSGKNADLGTSRAKFEGWKAGFGVAGAVTKSDGIVKLFVYRIEPKTGPILTDLHHIGIEWGNKLS